MDTLDRLPEIISRVIEAYSYDLRHRNKPLSKKKMTKLHARAILTLIRDCTDRIEAIVDYDEGFRHMFIPHLIDALDSLINIITLCEYYRGEDDIEQVFDRAIDDTDIQEFKEK
jgi:hypothetical protein